MHRCVSHWRARANFLYRRRKAKLCQMHQLLDHRAQRRAHAKSGADVKWVAFRLRHLPNRLPLQQTPQPPARAREAHKGTRLCAAPQTRRPGVACARKLRGHPRLFFRVRSHACRSRAAEAKRECASETQTKRRRIARAMRRRLAERVILSLSWLSRTP